jgi:hypothetical protein
VRDFSFFWFFFTSITAGSIRGGDAPPITGSDADFDPAVMA